MLCREGPAVLSVQMPKVSRAVLFFENVSNAESIQVLCAVFLSLLLSGHLVWYFERRANSIQFPMDYGTGVDHGLWWSVVTMTTGAGCPLIVQHDPGKSPRLAVFWC